MLSARTTCTRLSGGRWQQADPKRDDAVPCRRNDHVCRCSRGEGAWCVLLGLGRRGGGCGHPELDRFTWAPSTCPRDASAPSAVPGPIRTG
eukprot:2638406-Prymnesium_polylepis.1